LRHVDHPRAEYAIDADQYAVSRFDEIDETRLHPGAARARHGKRQAIIRPEDLAQHGHVLIHNFQKLWI